MPGPPPGERPAPRTSHSRADRPALRVSDRHIRRSGYLTCRPVTARPMIIRWISDVPSKMVKILAIGAVYAGQRPAGPLVSAWIQHALSETNSGFGPAPYAIGVRGAEALQSTDDGGQEVGGRTRRRAVRRLEAQVHPRYIRADLHLYRFRLPARAGGGARTGRTRAGRPGMAERPGLPPSGQHGGVTGRTGRGTPASTAPGIVRQRLSQTWVALPA